MQIIVNIFLSLSLSFLVGEEESDLPRSAPCNSRGVLVQMIFFWSGHTTPAESGRVLGIAKSGALPFYSAPLQWGQQILDAQYDGGKMPAEESAQWKFEVNISTWLCPNNV